MRRSLALLPFTLVASIVLAAAAVRADGDKPLVLPPLPLADDSGHSAGASTIEKAAAVLGDAAKTRGVRLRVDPVSVSPPPSTVPIDLVPLAASAKKAAEELDTKGGVRLHRELIDKLRARLVDVGDVAPLADARLSLASLYLATGEQLLAKTELDAAARLRPNIELDLSRWSPQVVEAFTAAQARVRAEPGADLDVKVDPPGAVVFLDGVRIGESPVTLTVRRGQHLVWIGAPGHAPQVRPVDVDPGSRTKLDAPLVAEPAWDLARRIGDEVGDGRRAEAVGLARGLAKEERASYVVVTGLVEVPGGLAFLLARADDEPRLAVVTLDSALTGAATTLAQGLAGLEQPPGAFSGGVVRVRGDHAPDPGDVKVDAKRALLGRLGKVAPVIVAVPTSTGPTGAVGTSHVVNTTPAQPPVASDDGFPWLAVGGTACVVVLLAGAGAALYFLEPALFQTPGPTVHDPDKTVFTITVAP